MRRGLGAMTAVVVATLVGIGCGELLGSDPDPTLEGKDLDGGDPLDGSDAGDAAAPGPEASCEATPKVFAPADLPTAVLVDQGRVYWANGAANGSIASCTTGECADLLVIPGQAAPRWLTTDANTVYWTTSLDREVRFAAKGATTARTLETRAFTPEAIVRAAGTDLLFWLEPTNLPEGKIVRCKLAPDGNSCMGGAIEVTQQNVSGGLAADSERLYWSEASRIASCEFEQSCAAGEDVALDTAKAPIALGSTTVYYARTANIRHVPKPNGTALDFAPSADPPRAITVRALPQFPVVYWLTEREVLVSNGTSSVVLATLEPPSSAHGGIAVDGPCVYWTTPTAIMFRSVPTP